MLWRGKFQISTACVMPVDSTLQHLARKVNNAFLYTEIIISASNTKAYSDHTMGSTENFFPKTSNMKTGGVSKLPIPIHTCTGQRAPGFHNCWTIGK
jgi:hypothetical protein